MLLFEFDAATMQFTIQSPAIAPSPQLPPTMGPSK